MNKNYNTYRAGIGEAMFAGHTVRLGAVHIVEELHQEGVGEDLRGGEWSHRRVDLFRRDRRDGQQHQRDIQDDSTMWRPFTASSHATSTHSHGHPKKQPHGHTIHTDTHTRSSAVTVSALQ